MLTSESFGESAIREILATFFSMLPPFLSTTNKSDGTLVTLSPTILKPESSKFVANF